MGDAGAGAFGDVAGRGFDAGTLENVGEVELYLVVAGSV